MSHTWLYKDTIESGIMVLLEDADKFKKEGYVDTPDDYGKIEKQEEISSLESMSKDELELYAYEMFEVEIDKRKSKSNIIKEIEKLEAK